MLILLIFLKDAFLGFENSLPINSLITFFVSYPDYRITEIPETPDSVDRSNIVIK